MLLTKEVEVRISSSNSKHFLQKGYSGNIGDKILINVNELMTGSHQPVEILCDYCNINTKIIPYSRYIRNMSQDLTSKNTCDKCVKVKKIESFDYDVRRKRNYWSSKENRLLELQEYINKFDNVDHIYSNNVGANLIHMFKKYNHDINEALIELNYKDVEIYKDRTFNSDFNNLADIIKPLIDIYGRFPSLTEIHSEIGFKPHILDKKTNLAVIKKILKYDDDNDLIDDRDFTNRSSYEYVTAQFLIYNNIPYLREQFPFKKFEKSNNHRSDFAFVLENNEIIHCEIWGMMPDKQEGKYKNYLSKMNKKLELYKKHNIKLISIYPDVFTLKYVSIQDKLIEMFGEVLNTALQPVEQEKLMSSRQYTDEQLLVAILKFSVDGIILPNFVEMKTKGGEYLYQTVLKRYNSILEFATKYEKKITFTPQGYWTKERVIDELKTMSIHYGYVLPLQEMRNQKLKLYGAIRNVGGLKNLKLELFENNQVYVTDKEIDWLYKLIRGSLGKTTEMQKERAKIILSIINI